MPCKIFHHLCHLKNVKSTHGGLLLLADFRLETATLLKVTLVHGCFSRFFKLYKWYKIAQSIIYNIVNPLATNVAHHIESSQLICTANQLTGFYMTGNIGR